jgi:hypothetical protein
MLNYVNMSESMFDPMYRYLIIAFDILTAQI